MKVGMGIAHYMAAPGACHDGMCEWEQSAFWTALLQSHLLDMGYEVVVAPEGLLPQKVEFLNEEKCDLVLEIHFNACGDCGASGCETLCHPGSEKGKVAAEIIQRHLQPALGIKDRGVKEGWYKMDRPGVTDFPGDVEGDEKPDYFLRATNCTALILEPEFIEKLADIKPKRMAAVRAIAEGIQEVLG